MFGSNGPPRLARKPAGTRTPLSDRAHLAPVFGERVSPLSFAGPKRFHAPPQTLQQLPPIEGLILSHDHCDHLDLPTIEYLAQRVQRYFVPLGVKARLIDMGMAAERVQEFDW